MPSWAPSLRELQCVAPSAGLRCKVQSMIRASRRSVPGATALPKWRPQRPEMRSLRKRSRQSLTVLTLQNWPRLTAAKVCPPAKPRMIRARRTSSARPLWLRPMRFNSRRSGGLNLKGAGMKKPYTIPSDVTVTVSACSRDPCPGAAYFSRLFVFMAACFGALASSSATTPSSAN